jgi:hypothetical protein
MTGACHAVIIHHSNRLHEGVADSRSHEVEATLLQILAHGIGFGGARWKAFFSFARIHQRLAVHKLPDVAIEAAELFLDLQKRACILHC